MGGNRVAIMVAPIIVAVVLVAGMQSAEAASYKVGGDSGWINPGDASFYSKWASSYTFNLNDVLEFDFSTGAHTVAQVSKDAYDSCDTSSNPISLWASGPASVTLNSTGSLYFICDVGGHCDGGQKLAVNVSTSSGTATPPPPNSASSLTAAAATSVIFGLVYVVGLIMN